MIRSDKLTDKVFVVRGVVEHGDERGRTIGFPTANLSIEGTVLDDGVWAGWVDCGTDRHLAAISVGGRPTFYGPHGSRLLEAHLLDFDEYIYDQIVTVWLCQQLRRQRRFPSIDSLVSQLHEDVAACRAWRPAKPWRPPARAHEDAPVGAVVQLSA